MIDNTYTLKEIIGYGGSSRVFSATDTSNNNFAIKAIRKDKGYQSEMEAMMVLREYLVMEHVGEHPNIVKHYSCNPEGQLTHQEQDQKVCYNVVELCKNGSLATIIKKTGAIDETVARFMFAQLSHAVLHLHSMNFAHLDIKLENTLLDDFFNVKLGDFGSGVSLVKTKGMTGNKVGTPLYMPPEVANLESGKVFDGKAADIYSLGVTLCLMLLGEIPTEFSKSNDGSTVCSSNFSDDQVMDVEEELRLMDYLSLDSKHLLEMMMNEDPSKRPTIQQVLAHSWTSAPQPSGVEAQVYQEMSARTQALSEPSQF